MKKLICGFLCVAVGVALADVESVVATIEVRAITSSLTNTIVAIPGLDLATGDDLAISNMVKTTNLAAGDKLVAFDGERYETWTLREDGGKHWEKTSQKITISASGAESGVGTAASLYTLPVGKGIWLSRTASGTSSPFYVYAQQPASTGTTIAAGVKAALVGNPTATDKAPTVLDMVDGDQIAVPQAGTLKQYTYITELGGWRSGASKTLPSIAAGTGFWYIPSTNSAHQVSITW